MKKQDERRGNRVTGFNILQDECIWMKSGVVSFRRCENAFDCNNCQFDKAMMAAVQSRKENKEPLQSFREKAKEHDYMERQCRHMLSGRVPVRKCGNDFRCDVCEFDQLMEDNYSIQPMGSVPLIEVNGYRYSDSYYYHFGHAWARVEYGGRVRVGLDDFALKLLGRPDTLELPKLGGRISQSEPAFALRREENRADVLSPIEGTVLAVNHQALDHPSLAHSDPYQQGWLFLVEPSKLKKSLEPLFFGETGKEWLHQECEHLHQMVLGGYGSMAATGAQPIDDLFGNVQGVSWKSLVKTFLRTE
jgi:glycine cleavage system H lipoate-binding protein